MATRPVDVPESVDTADEDMLETVRQAMGNDPRGAVATDESGKMSQEEANYRQGTDDENCSLCTHYQGGDQCEAVQSPISPDGLSDEFVPGEGGEEAPQGPPQGGGGLY